MGIVHSFINSFIPSSPTTEPGLCSNPLFHSDALTQITTSLSRRFRRGLRPTMVRENMINTSMWTPVDGSWDPHWAQSEQADKRWTQSAGCQRRDRLKTNRARQKAQPSMGIRSFSFSARFSRRTLRDCILTVLTDTWKLYSMMSDGGARRERLLKGNGIVSSVLLSVTHLTVLDKDHVLNLAKRQDLLCVCLWIFAMWEIEWTERETMLERRRENKNMRELKRLRKECCLKK